MATDLAAATRALVQFPQTIWADCKSAGIWRSERINLEPFGNRALPLAVVQIPDWRRSTEFTASGLIFETTVAFWRVAELSADGSAFELDDDLNTMVNACWPWHDETTPFQILTVLGVGCSDDLPPNQVLRSPNRAQRAGMVAVRVLTGDTG